MKNSRQYEAPITLAGIHFLKKIFLSVKWIKKLLEKQLNISCEEHVLENFKLKATFAKNLEF